MIYHEHLNTQGNINAQEPIILSGDRASRARFGTSIVNLGDVNDDGYEGAKL